MTEQNVFSQFEKWIPDRAVNTVYDVKRVELVGEEGLALFLRQVHGNGSLRLTWDRILHGRISRKAEPQLEAAQEAWMFFVSADSDYLNRFQEGDFLLPENTLHFFICGSDITVDILADEYPDMRFKWTADC